MRFSDRRISIRGAVVLTGLIGSVVSCADTAPLAPATRVFENSRPSLSGVSSALTSSIPASFSFAHRSLPLSRANDINDAGLVVGDFGGNNIAAYWTSAGGMTLLGQVFTGSHLCCSQFLDLNASGEAVGFSSSAGGIVLTRFRQSDNTYVRIPTVLGDNFSPATNDHGEITLGDGNNPYYIAPNGTLHGLTVGPAFLRGWSTDINNDGVIVGFLSKPGFGWWSVMWPSHTAAPIDLGSLGGNQSEARGINEVGDIVGSSEITPGNPARHATLWPAGGGIVDLHTWPNPCPGTSEAWDVNDLGVIVGRCAGKAVIWTAVEGMRYLPGPTSGFAQAINNFNVVVGMAPGDFGGAMWTVNDPPIAVAGGPYTGLEGQSVAFDAAGSSDPGGMALTYAWDFGDGSQGSGSSPTHTYADNGTYTVTLVVTDAEGLASAPASTETTIGNQDPALGAISLSGSPIAVGTEVTLSASFTDPSTSDTHSASVNWDDGAGMQAVTVDAGARTLSASRTFLVPGVYAVTVSVLDDDGGSDSRTHEEFVVVYDPEDGFVTGGGSIASPAGAYVADESLTGVARFGFVSKYHKGATAPAGNTEFHFHVAGFHFSSTSYEWLVVAGRKAQYKGAGTVNGQAGYRFLLTATDGTGAGGDGTDRFRIKIWHAASGDLLYDNVNGSSDDIDSANPQALASGSITIHKK